MDKMFKALISLMFLFFGMLFNLSDQVEAGMKGRKVVKVQSTKGWILGKRKGHLINVSVGLKVFIKWKGPACSLVLPGCVQSRQSVNLVPFLSFVSIQNNS